MGAGLFSQLMVAEETVYGTPVTPDRTFEFVSENLDAVKGIITSSAIRRPAANTRNLRRGGRRVYATKGGAGDVVLEVGTKGYGRWFKHMLGGTPTIAQQGATTAWLQTHQLGSLGGKSLTIQKGVEEAVGVFKPFTFHGCKVTGWTISISPDSLLQLSASIDAEEVETTTALATAAYVADELFHFGQGTLSVGGSVAANVIGASISGVNALKTDGFTLGTSGKKTEPRENDFPDVTGTLDVEFVSQAALVDRYLSDSAAELKLEFVGSLIASTFFNTVTITVPEVRFDGALPQISGPDMVVTNAPYTGLWNSTLSSIEILYTSTDVAI